MLRGETESESHAGRGVSPVISVILMVAIALILAAVVGAFVLGFGEETDESAPVVSIDVDREPVDTLVAGNEEIIIAHEGGENVPVSELRIITEAQCFESSGGTYTTNTKRGELYNLPVDFSGIDNSKNVAGDEIFETFGPATEAPLSGNDETWTAGERLRFQIDNDECSVLTNSETDIQVIHEPSNSRISEGSIGSGNVDVVSPASAEFSFALDDDFGAGDADLSVTVTKGVFRPQDVEMTVEVDDGTTTASETANMRYFDGTDSTDGSPEEFSDQDFVGPGDTLLLDIESQASGSGPGNPGFGPLNADDPATVGTDTDVSVTLEFNGGEIASADLVAEDFEVNP